MGKIGEVTALLPHIQDPQTEYVLLRACLALPKISFLLRAVNTSTSRHLLQEFDRLVRGALIRILGAPVNELQWLQAKLPLSMGGMGLRGAEDHAAGSHVSSLLSSFTLSRKLQGGEDDGTPIALPQPLLDNLSLHTGEEATVEQVWGLTQKMLSFKIDQHNLDMLKEQLEAQGDAREVARLASLGLPYAGAWLTTPPIAALGLHLQPSEFTLVSRYRLGIKVYEQDGPCPACLQFSDSLGDHALCCGHYGERITRHNRIRDHIFSVAVAAALGPVREGRFLIPGTDRRPADVFIPRWSGGRDAALDVTVINPLQEATVQGAAVTAGHALSVRFNTKMASAGAACHAEGITFIPLVFESLGGWEERAIKELKKLTTALARHSGEDEGDTWKRLITRVSILLMKGNTALLSGRIPTSPDATLEEGII